MARGELIQTKVAAKRVRSCCSMKLTPHFTLSLVVSVAALGGGSWTPACQAQEVRQGAGRRPAPVSVPQNFEVVPPIESQARIAEAVRRLRPQVEAAFAEAAAAFQQRIQRRSLIWYAGPNRTVLGSVAVESSNSRAMPAGSPAASSQRLWDRANVANIALPSLLIFTSRDLSAAAPAGFYLVRVKGDGGRFLAEFLTPDGRPVYQAPAKVTEPGNDRARREPVCTLGPRGELILFDYHDSSRDIVIEAKVLPPAAGSSVGPLVDPAGKLMQAADQILSAVGARLRPVFGGVFFGPGAPGANGYIVLWCHHENGGELCGCKLVHDYTPTEPWRIFSCQGSLTGNFYVIMDYQ